MYRSSLTSLMFHKQQNYIYETLTFPFSFLTWFVVLFDSQQAREPIGLMPFLSFGVKEAFHSKLRRQNRSRDYRTVISVLQSVIELCRWILVVSFIFKIYSLLCVSQRVLSLLKRISLHSLLVGHYLWFKFYSHNM